MRAGPASVTLATMVGKRHQQLFSHALRYIALAVLLSQLAHWSAHAQVEQSYSRSTEKNYDDVVDDLLFAISEQNYRITARNDIGSAISKRLDKPFPRSVIVHFCNLGEARRFLDRSNGSSLR